jgi:hypothetical protein
LIIFTAVVIGRAVRRSGLKEWADEVAGEIIGSSGKLQGNNSRGEVFPAVGAVYFGGRRVIADFHIK